MSIAVLTQVYDEVRRMSIAGSVVAAGDFRLKKLIAPLEQAGQKAPVFAKVAQAASSLIESDEKSSPAALLELSTLVNAILYTQGETGLAGPIADIKTTNLGQQQTRTPARVLKPLLEALTSTGSGRVELIKEVLERGVFRDLRLVGPALAALDDPYAEIGDLMAEKILPLYGPVIFSELRDKLDLKGRGGHVRRLQLMHRLDPAGAREFVKRALDEGSKEVRIQAIACLGKHAEDLTFLLEQATAKSKEVRAAALTALANADDRQAVDALYAALTGSDLEIAHQPVSTSRSPELHKRVLQHIEAEFMAMLGNKEKDKAKREKQVARVMTLLGCLRGRDDKESEALLIKAFEQRDRLDAIKGDPSGKDVLGTLVSLLAVGTKKTQSLLVEAHASLDAYELRDAFSAACRCRPAKNVFDLFSPYLDARIVGNKKKKKNAEVEKAEAIVSALTSRRLWSGDDFDVDPQGQEPTPTFDGRWLDQAVERGDLELVQSLAVPGHAGASRLLWKAFESQAQKSQDSYDLGSLVESLLQVEHPDAVDALIRTIVKASSQRHSYGIWWITRLVARLPKTAVPQLEALLPTLPDKLIDEVLECITQLKNRP